jgi:hypothetical protein
MEDMVMNESIRSTGWRWLPHLVGAAALAVALLLASAGSAAAAKDPIGGGETTLKPNKNIAAALADAGVAVKPKGTATATDKGIVFPVTGGKIFSGEPKGKVEHKGGKLRLGGGKSAITLKNPLINLNAAKLKVRAGGSSLKLFDLSYKKTKISRDGFATKFKNVRAKLSKRAAKILRSTYKLPVRKGTVFGRASVVVEPASITVRAAKDTTLAPDPDTVAAITGEGISIAPIGPASAQPDGLAFPITGGVLATSDLSGEITHSGGLRLSKGSTVVDLTDFTIQIDGAPDLVASVGDARVSILSLDLSGASIGINGTDVDVSGVEAALTQEAADALNAAFGTTLFAEGVPLGTATVAVHAR